jgi:hypothetical protein
MERFRNNALEQLVASRISPPAPWKAVQADDQGGDSFNTSQ